MLLFKNIGTKTRVYRKDSKVRSFCNVIFYENKVFNRDLSSKLHEEGFRRKSLSTLCCFSFLGRLFNVHIHTDSYNQLSILVISLEKFHNFYFFIFIKLCYFTRNKIRIHWIWWYFCFNVQCAYEKIQNFWG